MTPCVKGTFFPDFPDCMNPARHLFRDLALFQHFYLMIEFTPNVFATQVHYIKKILDGCFKIAFGFPGVGVWNEIRCVAIFCGRGEWGADT